MGDPRTAYTNQSLIGNWYEDRLDDSKVGVDPRKLRTGAVGETPIKMKVPKMTPEQFYTSTNTAVYTQPPRPRPVPSYNMINSETIRHSNQDQSIPDQEDKAKRDNDAAWAKTTATIQSGIAGMTTYQKPPKGMKGFGATGERLQIEPFRDPKENTFVQRSWLYNREMNPKFAVPTAERAPVLPEGNYKGKAFGTLGVPAPRRKSRNIARGNDTIKWETGIWSG